MFSSPILAILCLFYIFSSTALAASAVLGVDLGTEYIKAALVKPGIPLEIVLTKDSRRKETSAVAFKPSKNPISGSYPERVYGSDAVALAARFPGDVYPNLKPLLGLGTSNPLIKEYATRHPALQLEADKTRGTAVFRSGAFAADEQPWSVEEILAMELQSIQKNAEALAGSAVKDLVITVPVFYTAEEKRAVLLAADLAGLRVLELISDGLAVGLNYATSRTFPSISEGGKPEYHMVFDMGAGSTKATVLKFQGRTVKDVGKFNKTIQEVQVLGSGWDRTLGGDALNAVIVDHMIAQFVESPKAQKVSATAEKVQAHGRAAAKLWKEAERLRQILSANANTQASFEGLYEDVDFKYKISRAEFEKLAEDHAARVGGVIDKALAMVNLRVKDLDSIILHGGAIRTPFVQKELEKIVGGSDKIRTNVNADEAAVFGAGFRGAGLSPSFRVKEIRSSDGASYAAGIKYIDIHKKGKHQRLIHPYTNVNTEQQFTFENHEDFTIDFYQHVASSEKVSPGSAEKELKAITTQNLTESVTLLKEKHNCDEKEIRVHLSTRISPVNGEMEIMKLVVDCEVEEKESMVDSVKGLFGFGKKDQAPLSEDGTESVDSSKTTESSTTSSSSTSSSESSSKSASASAKEAPKSKKNLVIIPLKYETQLKGIPQVPAPEITRMKERIAAFDNSDRDRRLREEALNQLEGFTYKVRDLLENEEFVAASTETERSDLESKSNAASEWIYSGGADASRDELKAKLKEVKDIVTPIEKRREEATSRPEHLKSLNAALQETISLIATTKEHIKNETEAHSSFSASKSSASASPKTTSTATVDDFADLEDEFASSASSTVTAPPEEETMDPPIYSEADLVGPQELYDTISQWLSELLGQQEKLAANADPILLIKDLAEKTEQLRDGNRELLIKSLKQSFKSGRQAPPKFEKPKKSSTKSKSKSKSKTKKSKKTATATAEDADATIDLGFGGSGGKPVNGAEGTSTASSEEQMTESAKPKETVAHGEL
ncbi:lumenal Hsp70 protein [Ciborinia camelliae]|nr:lumenal Hsp70 protein [Ciborinia camelliae]